ncbi:HK97 family phage prohead protease [Sphingobium sp. AS12]|uniref:HK97 family phage prohead protease n=1 Tax=Sphingobium sp. AS12 TaxID=2849495 RepID=UPI001C3122E3|nr:HK97 family phage prohead protease [Sphingobium sp. AS12]MBV2148533.1 HK97 family phage prohead protease [Sphingobium sp. AS12]
MRMNFPITISSLDDAGTLMGIAAFDDGELNRNRRRYAAGAFDKSVATHMAAGTMPAMLLHHDLNRPVGAWRSIQSQGNKMYVQGTIERSTRDGAEAYALVKAKAIQSLSTGAIHIKSQVVRPTGRSAGDVAGEVITEADLVEISLVSVPANKGTTILQVNSLDGPREIEELFRDTGMSGRKAKIAASAAWRAINTSDGQADEALSTILTTASSRLARFKKD